MPNKTIYLSRELFEECKNINASEIISKLLKEYFLTKKTKEELISEKLKLEEESKKKIEIIEKQKERIEGELSNVVKNEVEEEMKKEQLEHKKANRISDIMRTFWDYEHLDITQEEAEEYMKQFDRGYTNMFEYAMKIKEQRTLKNEEKNKVMESK